MHGSPGAVDCDRHRHVFHLEFVNGFHAKILKCNHASPADGFGDEIGRTAHGDEINALVLLNGLNGLRAALSFSDLQKT